MSAINAERSAKPAADAEAVAEFEGQIRDLMRKEVTHLRKAQPGTVGEPANINTLVQRVSGTSLSEIDTLIGQMQSVRDLLQREGERMQRELAGYTQLSQTAKKHVDVISEQMSKWKEGLDSVRAERT